MKYGNRYPKWKKVLSSPISVLLFLILAVFLFKAMLNMSDKVDKIDQRLNNARLEQQKLVQRETDLKEKVDFLSTDVGIETEMRSKYKAVYEGEQVAVIVDESKSTTTATTSVSEKAERSWWRKLIGLIGL